MKQNTSPWKLVVLSVAVAGAFQACGPAPRRNLTAEEKVADMYWMYSQFGNNYAPIEYKQKLHGFDYEALKQKYIDAAKATTNNEDFYDVMYSFVAEFKDAHTSASINNSDLPGRAKVAYLGFSGVREGNTLVVTELLPTMTNGTYPISVGTVITKVDGVDLTTAIKNDLIKLRNLGSDEANLTYHANKLFSRLSTYGGLPKKDIAVLTIKDGDKEKEVILPWIVKDLRTFRLEQSAAADANKASEESGDDAKTAKKDEKKKSAIDSLSDVFDALGGNGETLFQLSFIGFDGRISQAMKNMLRFRPENRAERFLNNFTFVDNVARWTTKVKADMPANPVELLKAERTVPETAILMPAAKTYPAYVTRVTVLDAEGNETSKKKLVGVIRLDTFSPDSSGNPVEELKATLAQFNELDVQDILIDMIDNGGGSLGLGVELAQTLSPKKLELPGIQLAISETWLDDFESMSIEGENDYQKEIARRAFVALKADMDEGKRLSKVMPIDALLNAPEVDTETKTYNMVLLVNEMCASMCDIFSAMLQDNGVAKVVGTQTMGAGGNVVAHYSAPNSQLALRQTESLMLRKDGSYIENKGVTPDVAIKVADSASSKYEAAVNEALKILRTEKK